MALAQVLQEFRNSVVQCENLIANAHKSDTDGNPLLPVLDQQQITVAAFLNMFIAWERFLESSLAEFMTGSATINGKFPTKYVAPLTINAAMSMVIGTRKHFDYANHDFVKRTVTMYFKDGYPYEPHFGAMFSDLADLKTMRNASAHITSTTQAALEALAARIFGTPQPGITLYRMLTTIDPRSAANETVIVTYKNKLLVTAELIANG